MQLELFDFENNKNQTYEVSSIPSEFSKNFSNENMSDGVLQRAIDNLDLSADQKAMISQIGMFTINAGKKVIKIGRRILELALLFFKKFPATSFGLVLGLVVSSLIPAGNIRGWAIPVISSLVALSKKLIVLFAVGLGLKEDLKNSALGTKIVEATINIRKGMEASA